MFGVNASSKNTTNVVNTHAHPTPQDMEHFQNGSDVRLPMLPRLQSNAYNPLNHSIDYAESGNLRPLDQTRDYLNKSLDMNDVSGFKQS